MSIGGVQHSPLQALRYHPPTPAQVGVGNRGAHLRLQRQGQHGDGQALGLQARVGLVEADLLCRALRLLPGLLVARLLPRGGSLGAARSLRKARLIAPFTAPGARLRCAAERAPIGLLQAVEKHEKFAPILLLPSPPPIRQKGASVSSCKTHWGPRPRACSAIVI